MPRPVPPLAEVAELEQAVVRLVERAQARGRRCGADIGARDVPTLVGAAIKACSAGQWRRYVELVLDGLRPPA